MTFGVNSGKKLSIIFFSLLLFIAVYVFQDSIQELSLPEVFQNADDKSVGDDEVDDLSLNKVVVFDESQAVIKVIEESSPAVVSVVRKEVFFDPFRGPFSSEDSIGTGFLIKDRQGIVLTNRHVVDSADATYSIVLGDGESRFDVDRIFRDPVNDFAILLFNVPEGQNLPGLSLGDSDGLKVGQTVVAIGNALGEFGNSVTKGIVSGLGRAIFARASLFGPAESLDNIIQTDAALNPGNSGGPLLNLAGEVVGINVAISQGAENIGFSIPINTLKPVINDFYEKGTIPRPFLGVSYYPVSQVIAERSGRPVGAYVDEIVEDSPADDAGIEIGDIVMTINGIRLDNQENSPSRVISQQKVGEEIEIVVDRDGREITLKVTLEDAGE